MRGLSSCNRDITDAGSRQNLLERCRLQQLISECQYEYIKAALLDKNVRIYCTRKDRIDNVLYWIIFHEAQ
jgi:hypothetical protein